MHSERQTSNRQDPERAPRLVTSRTFIEQTSYITGNGLGIEVDLQVRETGTVDGYRQEGGDGGATGIESTLFSESKAHQGG